MRLLSSFTWSDRSHIEIENRSIRSSSSIQGKLLFAVEPLKLGLHRRVAMGELLDRDVLGFVVGEAELAVGGSEGVASLLQMRDGLVDFMELPQVGPAGPDLGGASDDRFGRLSP